ncbi:MAG TPA: type II toxin-antitoxin system VapC family toxin [Thermodesulfovibrionales bacterium]|nr:type II toxin-antitoxin system VapC family toxin [Thermodesulfovibrionales bacterium]
MVVVDSDILIWVLLGNPQITDKFNKTIIETEGNIFITPVQIAEIYSGVLPKEKAIVDNFMSSLGVIAIDDKIGRQAGDFINKYGKSHSVTLADAVVAAASRISGYELWTRNKKHYPMLEADEFFKE